MNVSNGLAHLAIRNQGIKVVSNRPDQPGAAYLLDNHLGQAL
ncbi:hypothetical protein [Lactobacillus delbrueckii]|nr:hypothetical protein [Lactobacillus delbrueckii]